MAVSIVLGKANSGKTVCCFRAMEEAAAKGKKVLLIVPDQGTYEAERRVLRQRPPPLLRNVGLSVLMPKR